MTLRKITIDNSVKYIPCKNSSPSENSQDHKPKKVSLPWKQKKDLPQNKKFSKNIAAEGFGLLKWLMNCYF